MATPSYTDDDIRQQVRICLKKIKMDDAFMESHLHASDYDDIDKNAMDTKTYDLFLKYVAMSMTNNRERKANKFVVDRLTKTDFVQVEIKNFDAENYVLEDPPVLGAAKSKPPKQIQVKMGVDGEQEAAKEKTDNKKRPRSKSLTQKETKASKKSRVMLQFSDNEKVKFAGDSKREYLSEKAELMERIPEEYSKNIGKIVFGKWKKDPYRPVLLAGPYQVPPGNLRDTWITMFENVKGDPKRMWYWCFWYGSPLHEAYTQQKIKEFVFLESAAKRNIDTLPQKIIAKVETNKKLTKIEEQVLRGFEELPAQLSKAVEDRRAQDFREDYESILVLGDDVSLPSDDVSMSGEASEDGGVNDVLESDDEEKVDSHPAKTKKGAKKASAKKPPKKKKPPAKKKDQPVADDFSNDIGEPELSNDDSDDVSDIISDDEKDDDFKKDEVEDEDEDDEDFQETKKSKQVKKKKRPYAVKEEVAKPKKEKKPKVETPLPEDKDPVEEERLAKRRERDQLRERKKKEAKAYEKCVVDYGGVVSDFKDAIEQEDTAKMMGYMKEIKDKVRHFSAPFIEKYKIPAILKSAKALLASGEGKGIRKEIWEKLKAVHAAKKPNVPEGWDQYLKSEKEEPTEERVKSEGTKKLKAKESDVEAGAAQENGSNGAKVKKEPPSEKVSSLDNSRHGGSWQSLDGQEKATDMSLKRTPDESLGSINDSNQVRVESSSSPVPPKRFEVKREGTSGSQVSNKYRADSSHPSMKAPKRKTSLTSLKSLLNKDIKTPKSEDKFAARKSLEPVVSVKKLPEWLTTELAIDSAVESNECRSLGLEFFLEVSEYFPSSVNRLSIARALEGAAYTWAKERKTSKPSWEGGYWEKLHTVVGSIGGKHKAGSLLAAIIDGKYPSAKSIIGLSDDVLMESFEGGQNGCY